jgi:hypothetical protein
VPGESEAPIVVTGQGRILAADGASGPLSIELAADEFTIHLGMSAPIAANYRDVTTVTVDQARVLMVLGEGAIRVLAEQLGGGLGSLVGAIRDRRARQMLADRFIEPDPEVAIDLVEYGIGAERGVAQLAYHPWGFALLPLDERLAWRLVRRADIASVAADGSTGRVTIECRTRPEATAETQIDLVALGADAPRHRERLAALRDGALSDASQIVAALMPDAPIAARQRAGQLLIDGQPVAPSQLGDAWPLVERAVLSDPRFAASYADLVRRGTASDLEAPRWMAMSPSTPGGGFDDRKIWFLIALPGNMVAFELVQEGDHATYLFRVVPRADYRGQTASQLSDQLAATVFDISDSLIDARFLREPIYLTPAALTNAQYLHYRLAIAALPSLRAARARFVGRLIHRDDDSWARALEDAIKWNGATRDDAAVWPGGAPDDATTNQHEGN